MTAIAHLSRTKAFAGVAFLGGGSLFILSKPFWFVGGIQALLADQDGDRGWWPILALASLIILPLAVRSLIRTIRHRGPVVFVEDAVLRCSQWRDPVPLEQVAALEISRFRVVPSSSPMVKVSLIDGSARRIQTLNLMPDTAEIARRIAEVAGLPEPTSR